MFRDNFAIILILPTVLERTYCMVENTVCFSQLDCGTERKSRVMPSGRPTSGVWHVSCYIISQQNKWKNIYAEKMSEELATKRERERERVK